MAEPQRALPPYRFGIDPGPHPTRHPEGHSFGTREPDDPEVAITRGVFLFDHGYYWEAHEAWEGPWRRLAREVPERAFLQSMIQAAAACLKQVQGKATAAERLRARAEAHLARAADAGVCECAGVTRQAVVDVLQRRRDPPRLGSD